MRALVKKLLIEMEVAAGAQKHQCVTEAAILALTEDCDVAFVHNGDRIVVKMEDIQPVLNKALDEGEPACQ